VWVLELSSVRNNKKAMIFKKLDSGKNADCEALKTELGY
jgi:hypothetical protein